MGLAIFSAVLAVATPYRDLLRMLQPAYRKGVREATSDLEAGRAVLYEVSGVFDPRVDAETGLPIYATGDPLDADDMQKCVDGYNDTVHRYIARHGLPPNSKKRWAGTLSRLERYWRRQEAKGAVVRLRLDGPAARSPHEEAGVRWATRRAGTSGEPDRALILSGPDRQTIQFEAGEREDGPLACAWGPKGAAFLVLCTRGCRNDGRAIFEAWDTNNARLLCCQVERPRPN